MAKKTAKKTGAIEAVKGDGAEQEVEWSEAEGHPEQELPGRKDLLFEAIRRVRAAMQAESEPSRTSVGNLVQLLKLHKELMEDEEKVPTEIQLVWHETEEELFAES